MSGERGTDPAAAAHWGRRTKIVATIGPATRSVATMTELIQAGADILRLNFSHGTREEHAENVAMAREASEVAGREVGCWATCPDRSCESTRSRAAWSSFRPERT